MSIAVDYEYRRNGTANLFVCVNGPRMMNVTGEIPSAFGRDRPLSHWVSRLVIAVLFVFAGAAALAPRLMPGDEDTARRVAAGSIFAASYFALAIGRVPGLYIDRAGIALVGASLMVASGAIALPAAYRTIDINTITLLLGMMIVVANLRLSGFFALTTSWMAARARRPIALLGAVTVVAGIASAFLVNDAICLVLSPLVLDLTLTLGRNPVPYLLAVAMASNIGSTATITGNPQNMLVGSFSGLSYPAFAAALAPVSVLGILVATGLIVALHRTEFLDRTAIAPKPSRPRVNRPLMLRSLAATAAVIALFFAGQPPAKTAIVIGALLLLTRRLKSTRVYAEIDWSLLLMFAGLFVITAGAGQTLLTPNVLAAVGRLHLDNVPILAMITAALSNLVSNVPAVLVIRPFLAGLSDPAKAWLTVAMASTLAGNLTLLGSVANLIVAEKAAQRGVSVSFVAYIRVGVPVTLCTLAMGIAWLAR
jgi:Na+/H+ antiporter NhaD/arsenite permease-like protein